MRVTTKLSLIAVAMLTLSACQQEKQPEAPALDTEQAKQAYSLGVSAGRYLESTVQEYDKIAVQLNSELILQGVKDGLAGNSSVSDDEIQTLLASLDEQYRAKQAEIATAESEAVIAAGKAYLEQNASKEGVTVTDSGLQYEVLESGDGPKPAATDIVKVHYTGTLTDGTKFDSSYDRDAPAEFPLNRVIPGWTEGVQLMNVGSKYKFTIPSELAYGERDMGVITPHSVLVFEVELLEIVSGE
ncbi:MULTISPECIES: FKBP-type peptidyl-prolyl cis-trans isomerase [unclassified Arsukibacterium]|uniref:FKBP-type peptidyl-prolyl cis-trans isomerase n=1 Tax=unclassified Arsukibacterium TaxID=2635278 RepID=UPI000C5A5A46|nr:MULTISPECIES: FKBP-type peptidyl-prolyl cis-trans isomerase [unclassified Arsukibacterium]MAA94268.1 peptidylprolyl isomerase [Rheinheimera sp.]MBM34648.1 peptidylprolyl isomerase [Rheinheimera sp.]HAW94053.1 peptidylprolyl isomerase [Candidatus Azambacteria bacterium]|tara:strand:+ start:13768 stop:14496 length:729 start_codon:yes stop_codon:yes gene_type:complete